MQMIIIIAAFATPLFFLPTEYPFAAPKGFFIIALGCIMTALLATLWISDRSYIPRLPKIAWVVGAYAVWLLISSLAGASVNASLWSTFSRGNGLITFFSVLILALGFVTVLLKKDMRRNFAWAMATGGALVVALHYIGMLSDSALLSGGSTLGNPSFAAAYLLFPIFAALYLACTSERKAWPIITAVFIASSPLFINIFGPHNGLMSLIGQSRAAAIALGIGTAASILLWMSFFKMKSMRLLGRGLLALLALTIIAMALLFQMPGSRVQEAFIKAATPTRILYGEVAREGIVTQPLFGYGLENYPIVFQNFYKPAIMTQEYLQEGWTDKPHNFVLEIGTSAGIVGLILYLIIYSFLLIAPIVYIRKGYMDVKIGATFFGLFLAYFLQNLFLFEIPATAFFFWMTGAWFLSYRTRTSENTAAFLPAGSQRAVVTAFWAVALAGIFFLSIQPAREAIALRTMKQSSSAYRAENAARLFAISPMGDTYDEARFIDAYAEKYQRSLPTYAVQDRAVVKNELESYMRILDTERTDGAAAHVRFYMTGAAVANNIYSYSPAGARDKKILDIAEGYAREAIRISPKHQRAYLELAKTYVQRGDLKTAITHLETAVDLEPRAYEVQLVLMRLILESKDEALFIKHWLIAREAIPNFDI